MLLAKNQLGDVDRTITEALGILGRYAKVERSYVFTFNYSEWLSYYSYEWCAEGTKPQIHLVPTVGIDVLADWVAHFQKGEHVYIPSIPDMAECSLKGVLNEQSIKSLIVYPMFHGKDLLGFVGFDAVAEFRNWNEQDLALLKIACDTIGSSLSNERYREELISAKEMAERTNAYKSEFLANMSHELRSPLNCVIGFSDLIEQDVEEKCFERIGEYAGLIKAAGKHLLGMITEILDLARIDTGKMRLEKREVHLDELLELIASMLKLPAREKRLSIELDCDPIRFEADERRLHQVLHNLLSNAIKFSSEGSRIGVSAQGQGEIVEIVVWDEGRGIAPDWLDRIFEPFEQVESGDSELGEGAGLGLAIVKRIVDLHGGQVSVESELGVGSRFSVRLPALAPKPAKENEPALDTASREYAGRRRKVLCVDDIEANLRLLEVGLSRCHFDVDTAKSGGEALERAVNGTYDIMLLDIKLPDMSGFEVFERLRGIRGSMPVIAVTASLTDDIRDRVLRAGFDGLHGKPIDMNGLVDLIEKSLDGKGA